MHAETGRRWRRFVAAGAVGVVLASALAGCDRDRGGRVAAAGGGQTAAPAPVALKLGDCAVIGASVSAGAEVTLPGMQPKFFGSDATLADVLGAITQGPPPASFADMMFFADPNANAEKQLAAAKERRPRIVFAMDYLFWHAYGAPMSDEARRKLLERGLSRLDQFECPVVIADLPDMSHAVGALLSRKQVPSKAMLDELNARIEAWAAKKPNVVQIKLREAVASAMAEKSVTLGGRTYEGAKARALLVANGLHTTADGLIAAGLEALDRLSERGLMPANTVWDHDPEAIKARLTESRVAAEKAELAAKAAKKSPASALPAKEPAPAGAK